MKKIFLFDIFLLTVFICSAQQKVEYNLCDADLSPLYARKGLPADAVYLNKKATPEERARDVVNRLGFEEKLALTGGWKGFYFPPLPRLGLSPVCFSDASQGIHIYDKSNCLGIEKTTAFPCTLSLAATWNPQLTYQYARAIGEECRAWGVHVLLGPGINLYRHSEGGRNFEYFGEDPLLTSKMAVAYVKGLQSTGTIATLKHFIGNEFELVRHVADIKIDERALREIYLPAFEASIKDGNAAAVMTGNNQVNGYPGAANQPLSGNYLRKELGFRGVIMSDWANSIFWKERQDLELGSGHSLLMADNKAFSEYVTKEIKEHPEKKASIEKQLGQMVFYNLYTFFKAGVYDKPYRDLDFIKTIDQHKAVALRTAEEAITLLKNDDKVLPLLPSKVDRIVVLGNDSALSVYGGNGSGAVKGFDHVDYLQGLKNRYGDKIIRKNDITDDEIKLADAVLYFAHKPVGEGRDFDFYLPAKTQQEIDTYSSLNKNFIVLYSSGNPMDMPWLGQVKGLIYAYLIGQQSGTALANVLCGSVNPSGRLPFSIEKNFDDSPGKDYNLMKDGKYYFGGTRVNSSEAQEKFGDIFFDYKEGIYVGYRWYDKKDIQPQFPFGYGLSYTDFEYATIQSSAKTINTNGTVLINFTIKNTGNTDGAEVAQLYIHPVGSKVDRPEKELKGFAKVFLKKGESKKVTLQVSYKDLAYWDVKTHRWKTDKGDYEVWVGGSSKDIALKTSIRVIN
jgi:beta-glucosidase